MKTLSVLRDWTKVLFVLSVILMLFVPGTVLLALINPEIIPFEFTIGDNGKVTIVAAVVIFIVFFGLGFYIYSLYLFRKILELFNKKKIFDNEVIVNFRKIGQFTWYGLLMTAFPTPLYRMITENEGGIKISFDAEWIGYLLFTGSLALFFTVLAEVFQMAKNIKEENELTI